MMVKSPHDRLVDQTIEPFQVQPVAVPAALDRDQDHIVVAVAVRIVAFPEDGPVLLGRKMVGVKPMGGAKPVAPRHIHLGHGTPVPLKGRKPELLDE